MDQPMNSMLVHRKKSWPSVGLEYKSQQHQLDEESEGEVREEDWVDLGT